MRARHALFAATAMIVVALPATDADAHIQLYEPSARTTAQKQGPCGGEAKPAEPAHVFAPGETISITFEETVPHPGHFRVALDLDGEDDFVYPTGPDDTYSNDTVLLDDIPDVNLEIVTLEVTLPNVTCETCTLQVVQVMYDKQAGGWGDDDLYFQCADIAIRGTLAMEGDEDTGSSDTGASDTASDASGPPSDTGRDADTVASTSDATNALPDLDAAEPDPDPGDTSGTSGDVAAVVEGDDDDPESCGCRGVRSSGTAPSAPPLSLVAVGVVIWAARRSRLRR